MIELSILVVSYNTRELTLACIESVYAQTAGLGFEVVVVDNASRDGSADAIASRFPEARLIRPQENIGFAAGNNLAARQAGGQFILLLNPDTVVLDEAIQKLYAFAVAHPQAGIFGGRTVFDDGSLNPRSCWRRPTLWSAFCIGAGLTALFPRSDLFSAESYGAWQRDTVREVDIVSGCFLMIRRSVWDELGGFDPAFFMYGEEVDLCLRALERGYKCLVCPDATIVHYGGASERVRADKMVRLFKAKAMLFERHWNPWARRVGIGCLDLWALVRMTAFSVVKQLRPEREESFETWRAIWRRRREWHDLTAAETSSARQPIGAHGDA